MSAHEECAAAAMSPRRAAANAEEARLWAAGQQREGSLRESGALTGMSTASAASIIFAYHLRQGELVMIGAFSACAAQHDSVYIESTCAQTVHGKYALPPSLLCWTYCRTAGRSAGSPLTTAVSA